MNDFLVPKSVPHVIAKLKIY